MENNKNNEGQRLHHIIRNGVKETVTSEQLHMLEEEGNDNIDLDMEWYLANGYVTAEEFKSKHP